MNLCLGRMLESDKGYALILVLSMLVILSLLGGFALNRSTTEIAISGNYRTSSLALVAAERAVEYAMGNEAIVHATGDVNLDTTAFANDISVNLGGVTTGLRPGNNIVRNLGPGDLPLNLAGKYDPSDFGANYYRIQATGAGPNNRSAASIETMKVRIFKKEDDTKLVSGGEG
jgi:Tfp pilus assembly protein PilX